jgi:aspartate racemase
MIEITVEEVQQRGHDGAAARRRGWRRVGVLGLGEPTVYRVELERIGLACETLPDEPGGLRDKLDQAITGLMAGRTGPEATNVAMEAVAALRAKGVDGIILGCTEIPLLLGDASQAPGLINPLALLAEAAVRFAIE